MSKLFIPADILDKMVCLNCSLYLSVFPIHTKNDSSGAVCGRCPITDKSKYIRDEAYETISQYLLFPCRHTANGCHENLTPNKLSEHEISCKFRKFDCPSVGFSECTWQGPRNEMLPHFEVKHPDLLLKNDSFELRFNDTLVQKFLLCKDDRLFLVKKEVESHKRVFICSVEHLRSEEEDQQFHYFLKVLGCERTYMYTSNEKSSEWDDPTSLTSDFLKEKLGEQQFYIVTVEIMAHSKNEKVLTQLAKVSEPKNNEKIDWEKISNLKCPICSLYMLPPIFECKTGHSFCDDCSAKEKKCPICRDPMDRVQNFTIEAVVKCMTYPCRYRRYGCQFANKALSMAEHEKFCEFSPYNCPMKATLGCQWTSCNTGIYEHIEENHLDLVLKAEKVDIPFSRNELNEKIYLIKFSKLAFKFVYKYENEKFHWEIQHVNPAATKETCRFEVDIIDLSGNKRRCFLSGIVTVPAEEHFLDPTKYVMVTFEQIQSFITDKVSFRIRIVKG
nr:uncharacterized protein LOC111504269 [Leptinotarsa decemlineata]